MPVIYVYIHALVTSREGRLTQALSRILRKHFGGKV